MRGADQASTGTGADETEPPRLLQPSLLVVAKSAHVGGRWAYGRKWAIYIDREGCGAPVYPPMKFHFQ